MGSKGKIKTGYAGNGASPTHIDGAQESPQGGRVFKRTGDGICATFEDIRSAVKTAERIQRSLAVADWSDTPPLKARIAIDTGEVEARGGDYFGPVVNRCARIMASGHGGQILLSEQSVEALKEQISRDVESARSL